MKIKFLLFTFLFACCLSAEEDFECEGSCAHSVAVSVDYLRWTPCSDRLAYAAEKKGTDSYSIHEMTPSATNGVRLGFRIEKLLCDRDLLLSWTYLEGNEKTYVFTNAAILPINVAPTNALYHDVHTTWNIRYNEWKALLGYDLLQNEYYRVKSLFGITQISLKEGLRPYFSGNTPYLITERKQHTSGIGTTLGLAATYRLSENFDCSISGSGSLLAGHAKAREDLRITIRNKTHRRLIGGYEIGALLRYDTSLLKKDTLIHAGYQFVQWYNIPQDRFNGSFQQTETGKTVGFHGLVLGADCTF